MSNSLTGTIKLISEVEAFDSGFSKRAFVVTTAEEYPQEIQLEFVKDKTALLDSFKVGDKVEVSYNLRGREWEGRYFVNLNAWRIAKSEQSEQVQTPTPQPAGDDLPF